VYVGNPSLCLGTLRVASFLVDIDVSCVPWFSSLRSVASPFARSDLLRCLDIVCRLSDDGTILLAGEIGATGGFVSLAFA